LVGSFLNARKMRIGFALWSLSNSYLIIRNIMIGEYAQAALFVANTGISIYGLIKWKSPYRDTEKFYVRPDPELVRWIYYNPDSDSGGQYVENVFGYDLIRTAKAESFSMEEFFEYIQGNCTQYLTDKGTPDFRFYDRTHRREKADFTDVTEETMNRLIRLAVQ